jgi:hypothetical protein
MHRERVIFVNALLSALTRKSYIGINVRHSVHSCAMTYAEVSSGLLTMTRWRPKWLDTIRSLRGQRTPGARAAPEWPNMLLNTDTTRKIAIWRVTAKSIPKL